MVALASLVLTCLVERVVAGGLGGGHDIQSDPFLVLPPGGRPHDNYGQPVKDFGERSFTLRHIYHHGSHSYPDLHRYLDVPRDAKLFVRDEESGLSHELASGGLRARVVSTTVQRMVDRSQAAVDDLLEYAGWHGYAAELPSDAWSIEEIAGPNSTDQETVVTFAKMAANAYVEVPETGDWLDVGGGYRYGDPFGWEDDGLRGHVFTDEGNRTVVIGLKGTSPAVYDGAETTGNDKDNDNLFGSCCCGQGGQYLWHKSCDCMTSTYTCNQTCLVKSLRKKDHYYGAARKLYDAVHERYPDSEIWLAGHSLGGVVSALVGLTYQVPVMTFEAYPDALAASRLGLPVPPGYSIGSHQSRVDIPIYHYGHTADPIYTGNCNGATSMCSIAGYAFQSLCHTGKKCEYDTVGEQGWRVALGYHRILSVISDVLEKFPVPECKSRPDCKDCYLWKFVEDNGTVTTTTRSSSSSSTSSLTRTRTETCKTPGWWGCLDETTTTTGTSTSTSTTSSTTTSTCKTPGWFGCKDPTTTSSATATPVPTITTTPAPTTSSSSTTTSCETPGWFGCKDTTAVTMSAPPTARVSFIPTHVPATSSWASRPSGSPGSGARKCASRNWYGRCKAWQGEVDGALAGRKTDL